MSSNAYYRLGLAATALTVLFLLFGIGALGIIGSGGAHDRMYLAVLAVLAVGAVLARLRPHGMVLALLATAATQVGVGVVALLRGLHDLPGASVPEILGLTAMYALLFAGAAWLFRQAEAAGDAPSGIGYRST